MTLKDLETKLIFFVKQSVMQGDACVLEALGLEYTEIAALNNFDPVYIAGSRRKPLIKKIEIDPTVMKQIATDIAEAKLRESIIDELLERGATSNLINSFFGIYRKEISSRRKLLGITSSNGRPTKQKVSQHEKGVIVQLLKDMLDPMKSTDSSQSIIQCQALIKTADLTRKPITLIWEIVQEFQAKGRFNW